MESGDSSSGHPEAEADLPLASQLPAHNQPAQTGLEDKVGSSPLAESFREAPAPSLPGLLVGLDPGVWSLTRAQQAAIGGAVASLALGVWGLLTIWLSSWTLLNALAGLVLGTWGLQSPRKVWAGIGIACSLLTLALVLWRWGIG